MKPGRDGERLALQSADDVETAIAGGRGIIGMTFEFGADFEQVKALERTARQLVQAMEDAKPNRHTATEAARSWNLTRDGGREREGLERRAFKEILRGRARHWARRRSSPARDGHVVIKMESDPETIEAGAEV